MAQQGADARRGNLRRRILSAIVLAPLVVAAVVAGPPWFTLLVLVAAAVLAWEWVRLVEGGRFGPEGWLLLGACVAAAASAAAGGGRVTLGLGALAIVLVGVSLLRGRRPGWLAAGFLYIAVPCAAILWLRNHPTTGLDLVLWLMAVTWSADTGAFFVGRNVGGPRLAPRISPGKTWSGFAGGLVAAGIAGGVYAMVRSAESPGLAACAALLLGIVAAGGDLLESATKRRFDVKDAGTLIPGHGGLLDRVDSLLLSGLATAVLVASGWQLLR